MEKEKDLQKLNYAHEILTEIFAKNLVKSVGFAMLKPT